MKDTPYGIFTICAPTVAPTEQGNMWTVDIAIIDAVFMTIHVPISEPDGDDKALTAAKDYLEDMLILALEALDPEQQRIKVKRANTAFENSWNESKDRMQS